MSGSGAQAGGSTAPFANVVNSNLTAEGGIAAGISNLNTNPASQYTQYPGYGNNLASSGSTLAGNQASSASAAGNNVIGNMFNDQSGYYSQLYQQNQDQTNAQNAMSGVAATPYGAALSNQSSQNFNNQWQSFLNAQQSTAANTASTLYGSANNSLGSEGSAISTGLGIGQGVDTQQYNAQQGSIQDLLSLLSTYSGAQNQTLGGALTQAGLNNTGAQQSNANLTSELSGLGSLSASLAKLGVSTGAL